VTSCIMTLRGGTKESCSAKERSASMVKMTTTNPRRRKGLCTSHKSINCWNLEKNKAKCVNKANKEGSNAITMTEESFKNMIMQLPMWNKEVTQKFQVARGKWKTTSIVDNYLANIKDSLEVADNDRSAEMTDYLYALYPLVTRPLKSKHVKTAHYMAEIIVQLCIM